MLYASRVRTGWPLTLLLVLAGCLQSPLVPCGDLVCPPGNVCTSGGCATPADVEACIGLDDGDPCRAANGGAGMCQGGACQTGLCGNGVVDVGEACDDGNHDSGDGCRGDCGKIELCGDGELDAGEACDDGNTNAADGCDACTRTTWIATAGVGAAVDATTVALANPQGLAADGRGRIFIADASNHRIRRIDEDGSMITIAGTGTSGDTGDGGAATSAELFAPGGVAVDGLGRVFVSDTSNHRLRMIDVTGMIVTIAGTGEPGYNGDGLPASLAKLDSPSGVAVDGLGRIYVADTGNHVIRRIDIDGTIATIAGTPQADGFGGDGGLPFSALLNTPYGVTVDALGRVLIADTLNSRIRRIELDGTLATIAGTGAIGFNGDGIPATTAELAGPLAVAVDELGRVVISDGVNERIRRIALDGTISTIAGTGAAGYGGDGSAATAALLSLPFGVAVDTQGRIAIADRSNHRIRRIATDGTISTVGGSGTFGLGGDATEATSAQLASPFDLAIDSMGRIYLTDTLHHCVRRIELDGTIRTIAGTGLAGYSGDGGPATNAQMHAPNGVAIDAQDRLVIADTFNHRIRRIDASGTITTIAGIGVNGSTGDGGLATSARLSNPNDVAIDPQGRVLIADTYNSKIRRIETDGTITTYAGTGTSGYDGDDVAATTTRLAFPYNLWVDDAGRAVIADTANHRVRRVDLDGIITTLAGNGTAGSGGNGGPATSAQLNGPQGTRADSQGRILIADGGNHQIRRIELDGTIVAAAGIPATFGASGDAGPPTSARFNGPRGLEIDAQGRLLVVDTNNHRIRRIDGGTLWTIAGRVDPENVGPISRARLDDPQAIIVMPTFTLVAGGASGTLEMIRAGRVEAVAGRYPQEAATGALARFRTSAFGSVGGVAFDPQTSLIYITEATANRLHVITQVDPADPRTWTIATLANTAGTTGLVDGAAASARFRSPTGLLLDAAARVLYIADTGNHAIRALDLTTNTVSTIANASGSLGFGGDDGPAASARLYRPTALARCSNGDLFVADTGNNRVRRIVQPAGTITTVLGDGVPASSGEGAPSRTFPVDGPRGLACDAAGNLFVTSTTTVRLLPASTTGEVDGGGAVQTIYGAPPRDAFPASITSCLTGVAVTGPTTVQVTDACTGLLVDLTRTTVP
jgi:cysteine-rich repeat protein